MIPEYSSIKGISIIQQGGYMMWPILVLGIIAIIIYVERLLYIRKGQIKGKDFIEGIKNLLRKKRLLESLTICEEHSGPIVNVLKSILLNHDKGKECMMGEVQTAAQIEITLLERRMPMLSLIVHIAPSLGLLGTFLSVYAAFSRVEAAGPYLNSSEFSGVISSALLTTICGIFIGVLAQIFYAFLSSKIKTMVEDMEWSAHNLSQFILNSLASEMSEGSVKEN
jgi:biopolymer transport protein ExbB